MAPEDALVVTLEASPRAFDPRFATSDYDVKLSRLLFSGLVTVDTEDGQVELDLAESIEELSPTRYRVRLRAGAAFHDGHLVDATDVLYTFGALGDEEVASPFAGAWEDVRIVVEDEHTLVFELPEVRASFALSLDMGIVPEHLLAESGTFGERTPVGAGPFQWGGQDESGSVWLRAFDGHPSLAPEIDDLYFRVIPDDNARLLALLGGSVDLAQNAIPQLLLPVMERDDSLEVEASPSFKYSYLMFNLREEELQDVRVRQAIAYAINREEIIDYKFGGRATLSTGMLPPHHWGYSGEVRRYEHDPVRAQQLLDAAGLLPDEDGCRMNLVYKTSSNRFYRSIAGLIAAQLGEVGLCVEVQSFEFGTFFGDIKAGNFQLASLQWTSVIDPHMYEWVFHSRRIPDAENRSSGGNRAAYRDDEVDAWIDEAGRSVELERRRELYALVQARLAEDLPYVSLWHEDNVVVSRSGLEGYRAVPNARFRELARASWVDGNVP